MIIIKKKGLFYSFIRDLFIPGAIIGASALFGFLSFSGMFELCGNVLLAGGSGVLALLYDGTIFSDNITNASKKIFLKPNYFDRQLANKFLFKKMKELIRVRKNGTFQPDEWPQFFIDYERQLALFNALDSGDDCCVKERKHRAKQKQQLKKSLSHAEKWFALQLFSKEAQRKHTDFYAGLQPWLRKNGQLKKQAQLNRHKTYFNYIKLFTSFACFPFMTLCTTYLLIDAFSVIPFFATIPFTVLPVIILPMALIAGVAYALLTYNAMTDMIASKTLSKWRKKIRYEKNGRVVGYRWGLIASGAFLGLLAVALTLCTAGTWWTLAKKTQPLFAWLANIPSYVIGLLNLLIIVPATLGFTFQNTNRSLEEIDNKLQKMAKTAAKTKQAGKTAGKAQKNWFGRLRDWLSSGYEKLSAAENKWQIFNPFKLLLKITVVPLLPLLFIGHILSISVMTDQVEGVPKWISVLIGFISELFEDWHYFDIFDSHDCKHAHKSGIKGVLTERIGGEGHGHDHGSDIPTRVVKFIFYPLYFLAAVWDSWASKKNKPGSGREVLDLTAALDKQLGRRHHHHHAAEVEEKKPIPVLRQPSMGFQEMDESYRLMKADLKRNHNKPQKLPPRLKLEVRTPTPSHTHTEHSRCSHAKTNLAFVPTIGNQIPRFPKAGFENISLEYRTVGMVN